MRGAVVVLPGIVKNADGEWPCDVMARRVIPETASAYQDTMVLIAPRDLADGEYTVEFDRHTFKAEYSRGLWLTSSTVKRA